MLLTAEPARTAVPQIVQFARENGVITAYDPNWRQPLWPNDETGIKAMKSLLPFADVVKAADEELEMLESPETYECRFYILELLDRLKNYLESQDAVVLDENL